jgi:hypothetical protein
MKIIVDTEEQKQELLKQSRYIHDFLLCRDDVKDLIKDSDGYWMVGLDSDKAGILMHIYMSPQIIEVNQKS